MSISSWVSATWEGVFGTDPAADNQSAEEKRRTWEAMLSKAICEGMTLEEVNGLVAQTKALEWIADRYWWLVPLTPDAYEGLRRLGGCPSPAFTPLVVADSQVAVAVAAEQERSRRWMMALGVGAVVVVGATVLALWPRRPGSRMRRRRR